MSSVLEPLSGSNDENIKLYHLEYNDSIVVRELIPGHLLECDWSDEGPTLTALSAFLSRASSEVGDAVIYAGYDSQGKVRALGAVDYLTPNPELCMVAVHPECRRRGYGSFMMKALEDDAARKGYTKVQLLVNTGNSIAIALYEKLGYLREAERLEGHWHINAYGEPAWSREPVFVMTKSIGYISRNLI